MTILLCHRLLVPLTGANSHNKIVIPTEAYPDSYYAARINIHVCGFP